MFYLQRVKKSHSDYEFYDTPNGSGSAATMSVVTNPDVALCDFCLKTSSCNKYGEFEELLMCKDCPAKGTYFVIDIGYRFSSTITLTQCSKQVQSERYRQSPLLLLENPDTWSVLHSPKPKPQ